MYTWIYTHDISYAHLVWRSSFSGCRIQGLLGRAQLERLCLGLRGHQCVTLVSGPIKKMIPRDWWQFWKISSGCIYRLLIGEQLALPLSTPHWLLFFFQLSSELCTDITDVHWMHLQPTFITNLKGDTGSSWLQLVDKGNPLNINWSFRLPKSLCTLNQFWILKTLLSPKVSQAAGEIGQSFSREPWDHRMSECFRSIFPASK